VELVLVLLALLAAADVTHPVKPRHESATNGGGKKGKF
jgi:hypothetical protein